MDRRSFITAAAVVPLAGSVGAGAAHDPLPDMVARWFELNDDWRNQEESTSEETAAWVRRENLSKAICSTRATSVEGVAAQIKYALDDFGEYLTGNTGPELDVALFDSVLAGLADLGHLAT